MEKGPEPFVPFILVVLRCDKAIPSIKGLKAFSHVIVRVPTLNCFADIGWRVVTGSAGPDHGINVLS